MQKNNGLAIASLVCSLVGLLCGVGALLGIIFGFVARNQIAKSNGSQKGSGMALAGIIIGFIYVALVVVLVATGSFHATNCTNGVGCSTSGLMLPAR